jgi:hypothetical protein
LPAPLSHVGHVPPNDAVEKVGEGLSHPHFGGLLTIPRLPIDP